MAERVESPPPGSAVTLSSLGPLMRGGEKNLLTDFPQIPSRPIRSKLFLSGVNDRLCLSHSRAVASAAIWITKRLKMKASLSSKKKKKKSLSSTPYSTFCRQKGTRPARVTLRSVRFREVFATLDVHGRQDIRLLPRLKQRTQRRWARPARGAVASQGGPARPSVTPAGKHTRRLCLSTLDPALSIRLYPPPHPQV